MSALTVPSYRRREEDPVLFGRVSARLVVECFAVLNLLFLGGDIYLAHSINDFAHKAEWIPVFFGIVAGIVLVPGMLRFDSLFARWVGMFVGWASVTVGVAGTILHLKSTFFVEQSLENLVYTAPFAAPMAFIGVGLLLILNRLETGETWSRWLLFLTSGSFVGLFALALADHAQNGFFHATEWIGVVSAAYAAPFLYVAAAQKVDFGYLRLTSWLMLVQFVVGIVGFVLHLSANLTGQGPSWWDRFVFGAPVFAPLLYPNMAILAWFGCRALGENAK